MAYGQLTKNRNFYFRRPRKYISVKLAQGSATVTTTAPAATSAVTGSAGISASVTTSTAAAISAATSSALIGATITTTTAAAVSSSNAGAPANLANVTTTTAAATSAIAADTIKVVAQETLAILPVDESESVYVIGKDETFLSQNLKAIEV